MSRTQDNTKFRHDFNPNQLPDTVVVINKIDSGRNKGDGSNTFQYDPNTQFRNEYNHKFQGSNNSNTNYITSQSTYNNDNNSNGWGTENENENYLAFEQNASICNNNNY